MTPLFAYLACAFVFNIPFGIYRARLRKLSVPWFLAIHLPIPFIILARLALDVSPWYIPAGFAVAIAGQVLGARALAPASWKAIGDELNAERDRAKAAAQA